MMINYINEGLGIGYILRSVALQNKELTILELEEELPSEEIRLIYDEESIINSTKPDPKKGYVGHGDYHGFIEGLQLM